MAFRASRPGGTRWSFMTRRRTRERGLWSTRNLASGIFHRIYLLGLLVAVLSLFTLLILRMSFWVVSQLAWAVAKPGEWR